MAGLPSSHSKRFAWLVMGPVVLLLLVIVAGLVAILRPRSFLGAGSGRLESGSSVVGLAGSSQPSAGGGIEVLDARLFKDQHAAGALTFVAELRNTTQWPLGRPEAKVTLYDASRAEVGSAQCTSVLRVLAAGERIPCAAMFSDVKSYKTFQVEPSVATAADSRPAVVSVSDVEYRSPTQEIEPHSVSGRITNTGAVRARSVWAIVALYDHEDKIAGVGSGPVAGSDLDPGTSATFKVSLYSVAAPVARYVVTPVGYE